MNKPTKRSMWTTTAVGIMLAGLTASSASAFIIPSKPVTTVPPVAVDPEPPIVDPPPPVDPPPVDPPPPDTGNPPPETNNPPPVSDVPEPGTLLLGLSAVGLVGWYRRRK